MTRTPLVSVLIDAYNHERFVEQAILSVLDQDTGGREIEVLVIDDGSTDGTADIVGRFSPRVTYVGKRNGGQASAFNTGLAAARGEIVSFLDADDYWLPGKLTRVLEVLEADTEVGAVGHAIEMIEGEKKVVLAPSARSVVRLTEPEGAQLFGELKALLGTSRFTARRSVLDRALPVPEVLAIEADEWLFTVSAAVANVVVLEEALSVYRLHAGNLFQSATLDPGRQMVKYRALDGLFRLLPPKLRDLQVGEDVIASLVRSLWVDAERIRLSLEGRRPWDTVLVEWTASTMIEGRVGPKQVSRRLMLAALAGCMPPRTFYRLRNRYGRSRFAGSLAGPAQHGALAVSQAGLPLRSAGGARSDAG